MDTVYLDTVYLATVYLDKVYLHTVFLATVYLFYSVLATVHPPGYPWLPWRPSQPAAAAAERVRGRRRGAGGAGGGRREEGGDLLQEHLPRPGQAAPGQAGGGRRQECQRAAQALHGPGPGHKQGALLLGAGTPPGPLGALPGLPDHWRHLAGRRVLLAGRVAERSAHWTRQGKIIYTFCSYFFAVPNP